MEKNYAYIDGNNLYSGINDCGWKLDFHRFRKWLTDKYNIVRAYYFIGLVPKEKDLYAFLQEAGYTFLSPSANEKCSILLKRTGAPITFLNEIKGKIELKRKNPR